MTTFTLENHESGQSTTYREEEIDSAFDKLINQEDPMKDLADSSGITEYIENTKKDKTNSEQELPEEEKNKSYGKRKKKDKRIDSLLEEKRILKDERDAYKKALDSAHLYNLSKRKESIESEIDTMKDVMKQSFDDPSVFVEAQERISNLQRERIDTDNAIDEHYGSLNDKEQDQSNYSSEYYNERYEILTSLSTTKDLRSENYEEYLDNNPSLNPFSEDFNYDLANKFSYVKRNFNEFLHANRKSDYIGSVDYYSDLDNAFDEFVQENYGSVRSQNNINYDSSYYEEEPIENDNGYFENTRATAPVRRTNQYSNRQENSLSDAELKFLDSIGAVRKTFDKKSNNIEYLSNDEKQRIFQHFKNNK